MVPRTSSVGHTLCLGTPPPPLPSDETTEPEVSNSHVGGKDSLNSLKGMILF